MRFKDAHDNAECIGRDALPEYPKLKIESEVAMIRYVKEKT